MTNDCLSRPWGRLFLCLAVAALLATRALAAAPATTAIRDYVYRADGAPARGHAVISWPAFTTADQKPVPSGSLTVQLGDDGRFDAALAPNSGATPDGSYYKVVFHLEGALPSTENWLVPSVAETTISVIRATVMPASSAVQVASRSYVDAALAGKAGSGANADITSLALGNGAPWLQRDAADALGLWHSATPQRFSVYNTRSDAANFERLSASWTPGAAYLHTENAGSGALRPLRLGAGDTHSLELQPGKAIATGVLSADGYLDMSGTAGYAINGDPPAFGGTGVGWKLGLWQNIYAIGIANNTLAMKSGKWLSVFNGNPAGDATSAVPDSQAGVSLGGDGTLLARTLNSFRFSSRFGQAGGGANIDAAVADIKNGAAGVGCIFVPPGEERSPASALNLANNQAICILDFRVNRASPHFGQVELYTEGRDNNGSYASEFQVTGKQNPAVVVNSVSDGTANGYPVPNKQGTFLFRAHDVAVAQLRTDTTSAGQEDFDLALYPGGVYRSAMRVRTDNSNQPRVDLAPSLWAGTTCDITDASNTSPIVVTLSSSCVINDGSSVTVAGATGNNAANGTWVGTSLTTTTIRLRGSAGNGAYLGGGTLTKYTDSMRGTLNVPKVQGGNIAISTNGQIYSSLPTGTQLINTTNTTPIDYLTVKNCGGTSTCTIGGGTPISGHVSATASLDFPNTPASNCSDLTIAVAGAAAGDTVALGVPNGSVVPGGFFSAWVSAADTVTVRFCALATGNPASGSFRVDVWKH